MRRVFRDYVVLLAAPKLTQHIYQEMLDLLKFGRVETTHDDKQALTLIKRLRPDLVVSTMSLGVFTGPQLLSAARDDPVTHEVPFVIIGVKEDAKPGGIAEQIDGMHLAKFVGLPVEEEQMAQLVLDLIDPLIDPDQEKAYGLMDEADAKAEAGLTDEAIDLYQQAVRLHGKHPGMLNKLGMLLTGRKKYDQAEEAFFKALAVNNYSFMAYIGLADLYERRQDFDQTIGVLKQALGLAKVLKVSDRSVSRLKFFIGEFELRLKRLTEAEEAFQDAVETAPQDAELRLDIGDAYMDKGYYQESEKHYEAALAIDPNLAHVFNRLGIAYRRQGKYDKALDLYDRAQLHHPKDEHLMFNIARAHFESEAGDRAMDTLEQALRISPKFKEAKSLMAKVRALGLGQVDARPPDKTEKSIADLF
jgi:tetratricopeptide (TPR) repeat protein